MKWTELDRETCSLARALAVVGDRWTLLILRDAFLGVRRFEGFERSLKISRRMLADRLAGLVAEGLLEQRLYQERPPRHEYRLTEKGLALYPALLALVHWGDDWYAGEAGPPLRHRHRACDRHFHMVATCSACGEALDARAVIAEPAAAGAAASARVA
jgi:DNA-binding HxlR family transcriptional regulator